MKKIALIVAFSLSLQCNGQVLEVIDAIGGSLLPKVVEGIKEIRNSGSNNKIKIEKEVLDQSTEDLREYMTGITTALSNDMEGLEIIGSITQKTSKFYDDLGAIQTMSNTDLISAIIDCGNENVRREYSFAIDGDLEQLKKDIEVFRMDVLNLSIDQNLKDKIVGHLNQIEEKYTDLSTKISQSGVSRPNVNTDMDGLKAYLEALSRSSSLIGDIKDNIGDLFSTLNSRLQSHTDSVKGVKKKVDDKFDELKK